MFYMFLNIFGSGFWGFPGGCKVPGPIQNLEEKYSFHVSKDGPKRAEAFLANFKTLNNLTSINPTYELTKIIQVRIKKTIWVVVLVVLGLVLVVLGVVLKLVEAVASHCCYRC